MLKQTSEFSKEKLEELVNFVLEKGRGRAELMAEVLKVAASKFPPSSNPFTEGSPPKIIWTVEGWGASETLDANNVKELKDVAKAVGINFTILEVQEFGVDDMIMINNLKMIADHAKQQSEKLANFEVSLIGNLGDPLENETFLSLCKMSIKWKTGMINVATTEKIWTDGFKLEDLAGGSLDHGHIGRLIVHMVDQQEVNLNGLQRVWAIADEMELYVHPFILPVVYRSTEVIGGRGKEKEATWQRVVDFVLNPDDDDHNDADDDNDDV